MRKRIVEKKFITIVAFTLMLSLCVMGTAIAQGPPGGGMPDMAGGPPGGGMPGGGPGGEGGAPEMDVMAPGGFIGKNSNEPQAVDGIFKVMTVNGVETPMAAGTYKGTVVIEELDGTKKKYYESAENMYQSALFIEKGDIVPEKSATSALKGGKYDGKSLKGVSITAKSPYFNGITLVEQDYSISKLTADFSGDGGNDMAGTGAVVSIFGKSDVSISKSNIVTSGTARAGIFGGAEAIDKPYRLTLEDTTIIANGHNTVEPTAVWMLGLFGDVRAVQYVGYFDILYDNVTIKSAGWAIVSVDDVNPPTQAALKTSGILSAYDEKTGFGDKTPKQFIDLYYWSGRHIIKNSDLSILSIKDGGWGDGYGAYSIGANLNVFDNTVVSNVTYGGILANEYASVSFENGSVVNSNRFGVYSHSNKGGLINIDNATLNTKEAVFLLKSASGGFGPNATMVEVTDSKLNNTGNEVILLLMDNDDPGRGSEVYAEDGKTVVDQKIDIVDKVAARDANHDLTEEYKYLTSEFMGADANYMFNAQVHAYFTDCKGDTGIEGDFYNARTEGQNLVLHFSNSEVEGVISSGTTKHDVDTILKSMKITDKDYEKDGVRYGNRNNLGDVTVTAGETVNNGVIVYLENDSEWDVEGTAYISKLVVSKDSKVDGNIKADSTEKTADGATVYLGVVATD
jgi:hypothetical protein